MGVFTEQVQGLVSEERTKRQERERKQREKNFLQELERELYYIFNDTFEQNKDKEKNNKTAPQKEACDAIDLYRGCILLVRTLL